MERLSGFMLKTRFMLKTLADIFSCFMHKPSYF